MTREALLEIARKTDFCEEVGLVDEINQLFDDLETRTCANCKWYSDTEVCTKDDSPLCCEFVSNDFGCNKFERSM